MATLSTVISGLTRRLWSRANKTDMVSAINIALETLGNITQVDETTTVVNDQTEYSLPTDVSNVVRVQVATDSTADYDYETVFNWREINGKLYFDDELDYTAGRKVRIYYNANHSSVSGDTDTISDDIPIPLITASAAYYYYLRAYADGGTQNKQLANLLEEARRSKMEAELKYRINRIYRDPILN